MRNQANGHFMIAGAMAAAAMLALAVDLPVASFFRGPALGDDFAKLVDLAEAFAHGYGILCILAAVAVLDPPRRRGLPRMIAITFGAGLAVNVVKVLVWRARPRALECSSVWETFRGWLPLWNAPDLRTALDGNLQSFCSGHTATAVGLAISLSFFYPRGRWLFALFAALAATQRLESQAHYLSDTFAAAAVAFLCAAVCTDPRLLGRWFDAFERRPAAGGPE